MSTSRTGSASDDLVEEGDGGAVLTVLEVEPGHPGVGMALVGFEGPHGVGDAVGEEVGVARRRAGADLGEDRVGGAVREVDVETAWIDGDPGGGGRVSPSEDPSRVLAKFSQEAWVDVVGLVLGPAPDPL